MNHQVGHRRRRVIHCGTGLAGCEALRAIIEDPTLELAGLLIARPENAGRDAGGFVGRSPTGILATTILDDIIAIDADIVCYMLVVPNVDDICRLLASGKNVVTTAGLIFPAWRAGETRARLEEACREGNSSFYATGINPGWVDEVLPLVMSSLCRDIEHIAIREYADCAKYPARGLIFDVMGFGHTPEAIAAGALPDMTVMSDFFAQAVAALGHGVGIPLDDIVQTREFVTTPHDIVLPAGTVKVGTVAGQRWRWVGSADGVARIVQETFWVVAFDLGPGWPETDPARNDTQWQVTIEGTPSLRCTFEPRASFKPGAGAAAFNPSAVATAMAAVNSLLSVCDAPAGLLTSIDLKLPRLRRVSHV
jgi:hypothetical protein